MTFAHPWVLLLLVIPVLLLVWGVQRRDPGVAVPIDHGTHGSKRLLFLLLGLFECMPALVLAGALVLLAGPQSLRQSSNERVLTNIQICMDVSGSMGSDGRYKMAKEAIEAFTLEREGDAFGLTLFGSHQIRWVPLTTDLKVIRGALPFANPRYQPIHMVGTRIGAALLFCRDNMLHEAEEGDRLIILVSDGFSSDLGDGFAEHDIADELKEADIKLYHIHVGTDEVPPEVVDIADRTGGDAFVARDEAGLAQIFRHIDKMRPAKFKPGGTMPMDHFAPFALAALLALGLHTLGLLGIRSTPW